MQPSIVARIRKRLRQIEKIRSTIYNETGNFQEKLFLGSNDAWASSKTAPDFVLRMQQVIDMKNKKKTLWVVTGQTHDRIELLDHKHQNVLGFPEENEGYYKCGFFYTKESNPTGRDVVGLGSGFDLTFIANTQLAKFLDGLLAEARRLAVVQLSSDRVSNNKAARSAPRRRSRSKQQNTSNRKMTVAKRRNSTSRRKSNAKKSCRRGLVRNPKTGRCVKRSGAIGKQIAAKAKKSRGKPSTRRRRSAKKSNPRKGKVLNPKTGRYVNRDGALGKKILADRRRKRTKRSNRKRR